MGALARRPRAPRRRAPSARGPLTDPSSRLGRRLSGRDAVVVGLGSMLGAGVFAAVGPAADAAGSAILLSLVVAAAVAWCNATSSAQLAARHPQSGGAYVYGRERLGRSWGLLAGATFVVGKTASCAAMALTFATYAAPSYARPLAAGAVVAVVALNIGGVARTVAATRVLVGVVVAVLVVVVVACLAGGSADVDNLVGDRGGALGVLEAAAILFFAFAGYARIATLGEEVRDPERTIPRAIPAALGIVLVIYGVVFASALLAAGIEPLANADAPLAAAVRAGDLDLVAPIVRAGAAVASLGVLLALLAGVGRTVFAMAADGELPRALAAVNRRGVPHRAELIVGAAVLAGVIGGGVRGAIGLSAGCVLVYYAVANAAALRLTAAERLWPRWWAAAGLAGCVLLAGALVVA